MRSKLRIVTLSGGTGAVLVLVLLSLAAGFGSWMLAIIGGLLGILLVIVGCMVLLTIVDRLTKALDRSSTRARNLESRTEKLAARAEEAESGLDGTTQRLDGHDQALVENANARGELTQRVEALRSDAARTNGDIRTKLATAEHDLKILRGRLDEDGATTETLRDQLTRVRTLQERDRAHLDAARKDIRTLRARVPAGFLDPVESNIKELRAAARTAMRNSFESGIQFGREPRSLLSPAQASRLFVDYLSRDELLQLRPLIENFDLLEKQSLTTLRRLYRYFRSTGYWELSAAVVTKVHEKTQRENDALAVAKIEHEIDLFSQPSLVTTDLPEGTAHDPEGPILHMVGRVLPETQTGYTLRTQYTALAQARRGLPVAIVGQAGIISRSVEQIEHYTHQEIDYFLLPGPARNEMLVDDWLRLNMKGLADLVQQVRPSVLHAQSDFFNALIVNAVGKRYGIPTVYESRGFWEESWLSRTITANSWGTDSETLFDLYGMPEAYSLRKHAEEVARLLPDHVFTLAEVMRDHILDSAQGTITDDEVSIVPNAVESSNFPVQEADRDLAAEIGLPQDAVVVGYI